MKMRNQSLLCFELSAFYHYSMVLIFLVETNNTVQFVSVDLNLEIKLLLAAVCIMVYQLQLED